MLKPDWMTQAVHDRIRLNLELRRLWLAAGQPRDLTEFAKDARVREIVETFDPPLTPASPSP